MKEINPNVDYTLTAPTQYISRSGVLDDCGRFILKWGKNVLVSGGTRAMKSVENKLFKALDQDGVQWKSIHFAGECSTDAIEYIVKEAKNITADAIIGVGGGKSLDAAKAAAAECNIPIICVPTTAATCAAASPLSVVYTPEGVHERDVYLDHNPQLVLVDPEVIAAAPVEYIESGILDSLAKWYEGRIAVKRFQNPDIMTVTSINMSKMLNDIMEKEAVNAVKAVKVNQISPAVVTIIDLNIYVAAVIQSIGKLTRGAAAHCIHSGLSILPESHPILHGFKVGYGMIVQLVMENAPLDELKRTIAFFRQLDLEPSFKGMKLPYSPSILRSVAQKSMKGDTIRFMPFEVTDESVAAAMKKLEEMIDTL